VALVLAGTATAQIDPASVTTGHVYLFEEIVGTTVPDDSANTNDGTIVGDPQLVDALKGKGLQFDGVDDQVTIPDSGNINTGGPFPNRTVIAMFKCDDVDKEGKQTIFEEGGRTRGAVIYVFEGQVYVGAWNRAEYNWNGEWISAPIGSDEWHAVSFVIRDASGAVEDDKFEMWMDGQLIESRSGGQLHGHGDDTGIGATNQNVVFHDDDGSGSGRDFFGGVIDEVWILNDALTPEELAGFVGRKVPTAVSPDPGDGAMVEDRRVNLSWRPGAFAVSHDVYLGESFDDVNEGAADTFLGNQTAESLFLGLPGQPYGDGLTPGQTYYWRIDEVNDANAASPWKGNVWSFRVRPLEAWSPNPPDGTQFVDPNEDLTWEPGLGNLFHTVVFGESFEEVDSAATGAMLSEATYDPGSLMPDTTYYWRVDQFSFPGNITTKGDVWSFTTLPEVPITDPDMVLRYTFDEGVDTTAVDRSGNNHHATLVGHEWVPAGWFGDAAIRLDEYGAIRKLMYDVNDITAISACAWVQTDSAADQYVISFDRNEYYRLEINGNGAGPGQVGWDVMTEAGQLDYGSLTRVDDGQWHHICGVWDNGTATIYIDGEPEPSAVLGTVVGTGNVRYGFIGANSEATEFNGARGTGVPIDGLMDDIRVYRKALTQAEIQAIMRPDPQLAYEPNPGSGARLDVTQVSQLTWRAGDGATQHDVYLGTDRDAVIAADATDETGIYQGRQTATSYSPTLEWGMDYFWRVDEVAADGTAANGTIWSFTITDYLIVDDFESYTNFSPNRVFQTWIDGLGFSPDPNFPDGNAGNGTNAIVGYDPAAGDIMELAVVNSDSQSMPVDYNNVFAPGYAEAERTFVPAQNWTREGVTALVIHFAGRADNTGQLYAEINGTRVNYPDDAADIASTEWIAWEIDLASVGTNLTSVSSLTIGIEGGAGLLFIDDIRLTRP
jgi:hypothetical protein